MAIKAIIFDFDGVIHDTFEIVFRTNKKVKPTLTKKEYRGWLEGNFYKTSKVKFKHYNKFFELQEKEFNVLKIDDIIKKELLRLNKNYSLFVISSNKESTLKNYFKNNGILRIFKEVLGFETNKSKEIKFNIILKKYRLEKGNPLKIVSDFKEIQPIIKEIFIDSS
jgi:phosphoglycolate phosphatase-like HAD superfamily hydrolase